MPPGCQQSEHQRRGAGEEGGRVMSTAHPAEEATGKPKLHADETEVRDAIVRKLAPSQSDPPAKSRREWWVVVNDQGFVVCAYTSPTIAKEIAGRNGGCVVITTREVLPGDLDPDEAVYERAQRQRFGVIIEGKNTELSEARERIAELERDVSKEMNETLAMINRRVSAEADRDRLQRALAVAVERLGWEASEENGYSWVIRNGSREALARIAALKRNDSEAVPAIKEGSG